jgi:2-iminobutanoate/2-iminopropanoate deaminase
MKKINLTKNAPAPVGPYSQAVTFGDLMFCSGMIPIDPVNNEVLRGDIRSQTELVMKNIGALLAAADLTYGHVLKATIFLTEMADFSAVNEVYAKYFSKDPPARSTIAVKELPKGVNVEIEIVAHR